MKGADIRLACLLALIHSLCIKGKRKKKDFQDYVLSNNTIDSDSDMQMPCFYEPQIFVFRAIYNLYFQSP